MKNNKNHEDFDRIFEELDSILEGQEQEEQKTSKKTKGKKGKQVEIRTPLPDFDKTQEFEEKVKELAVKLGEIMHELGLPFLLSVNLASDKEKNAWWTAGNLEHGPCELLAQRAITELPHEFSHKVLDQAQMFFMMSSFMENLRNQENNQEDQETPDPEDEEES